MADEKSHISWGFLLGLFYAGAGAVSYSFGSEAILLAFLLVLIGSILPNLDSTDQGITGELSGLIGAIAPILVINYFAHSGQGVTELGSIRMALIIIFGYSCARVFFSYLTNNILANRGALHSIPSAILFSEIGYLSFSDLNSVVRSFLGLALGVGVLSHVIIDAFTNMSIVKKTVAKNAHSGSVIKFTGASNTATWILYILIVLLGWFVARDISPSLKVQSPISLDGSQPNSQ